MAEYRLQMNPRVTLWHWNGQNWDYVSKIWRIDYDGLVIGTGHYTKNKKLTEIEILGQKSRIIVSEVE